MTTYPTPTTDADEFVAGMVAADRDPMKEASMRPGMIFGGVGENRVVLSGGTYTATEARILAERLVDAANTIDNEASTRAHFEVLNEAMDEQP